MEVSVQLHAPAISLPRKKPQVPTGWAAGRAPGPFSNMRKNPSPYRESNSDRPVRNPVTELPRLRNYGSESTKNRWKESVETGLREIVLGYTIGVSRLSENSGGSNTGELVCYE
jgi:hypothetical protein